MLTKKTWKEERERERERQRERERARARGREGESEGEQESARESEQEQARAREGGRQIGREAPRLLAPLFICCFCFCFVPPPALPYVNWASQECCLFYLGSSLLSSDLSLFYFFRLFPSLSFSYPRSGLLNYSNYLTLRFCTLTAKGQGLIPQGGNEIHKPRGVHKNKKEHTPKVALTFALTTIYWRIRCKV